MLEPNKDGKTAWVLGIDTGTHTTGWAFLPVSGDLGRLGPHGKIVSDKDYWIDRLMDMVAGVRELIFEYGVPVAICVEQPNSPRNMESIRQLCGLYGYLLSTLTEVGFIPTEVNTSHAKACFTGNGKCGKDGTIDKANELYGSQLEKLFQKKGNRGDKNNDEDVCDAIQVAYTGRQDLMETEEFINAIQGMFKES